MRASMTIGTVVRRLVPLAAVTLACSSCVSRNALIFYEGAKLGFTAQFQPNSAQPIESHLGFKRRVIAVVPPKKAQPGVFADPNKPLPTGEALSLVSTFEVRAHAMSGVEVHNYFASGTAAVLMTNPEPTVGGAATGAGGERDAAKKVSRKSDRAAATKAREASTDATAEAEASRTAKLKEVGRRVEALMEKTPVKWPSACPFGGSIDQPCNK